jgi:hypothetical protein
VAVQAEEGAAHHLEQQLVGLKAAERNSIHPLKAAAEDRVDHQVVAVGGEFITPAQLGLDAALVAGDAIDLQLELASTSLRGVQKEPAFWFAASTNCLMSYR